MKKSTQKLQIEQMDRRLELFKPIAAMDPPSRGWIRAIRTSLNMSIRQYAMRMGMGATSAKDIEEREKLGTISLNALRAAARALNLDLVYGFVPKEGSLDTMINKRAVEVSREIVMRTNTTMGLEDQQVKKERLEKAIAELADEIKREMPKYLWD
jgi:predicted DNA-binding mobile mystery protein A